MTLGTSLGTRGELEWEGGRSKPLSVDKFIVEWGLGEKTGACSSCATVSQSLSQLSPTDHPLFLMTVTFATIRCGRLLNDGAVVVGAIAQLSTQLST